MRLIRAAIAAGIPVFAICRGLLELNVALGGSLHQRLQDLPDRVDHSTPLHPNARIRTGKAHEVRVTPGSWLHRLAEHDHRRQLAAQPGHKRPRSRSRSGGGRVRRHDRGRTPAKRAGAHDQHTVAPRVPISSPTRFPASCSPPSALPSEAAPVRPSRPTDATFSLSPRERAGVRAQPNSNPLIRPDQTPLCDQIRPDPPQQPGTPRRVRKARPPAQCKNLERIPMRSVTRRRRRRRPARPAQEIAPAFPTPR